MAKENIAEKVSSLIREKIEEMGYILWDTVYAKEGADYHLTVTIDKEGGINITDCEAVTRAIDPILDEADPIEDAYFLDVSSPGIERSLRTDAHLAASIGQRCIAKLFCAIDGKRSISGELLSFDAEFVVLSDSGKAVTIPRTSISKMNILFF